MPEGMFGSLLPKEEYDAWQFYRRNGGRLGFWEWQRAGRPMVQQYQQEQRQRAWKPTGMEEPQWQYDITNQLMQQQAQPPVPGLSREQIEYNAVYQRAVETARLTGRKVEDVFAELLGLSPTRPLGMSEYEQAQLDLRKQEAAQEQWWRQTSVLENAKQRAHEQAQQRLTAIFNRPSGGEAERAQASDLWNEWRNRIAAATPDWDFMKKWQVGQMEDPFAPPKLNPIEEVIKIKRETDALKIEEKGMKRELADLWEGAIAAGEGTLQSQELANKAIAIAKARQSINESIPYLEFQMQQRKSSPEYKATQAQATPRQDAMGNWSIRGEEEVVKPKGPEAPSWLSKYVPEYPAGTEITKPYKVAPASLQALSQAAPSELLGLKSYLTYAGQKPEDWLAETMLRQTKTPAIAGGWSPASQRA